MLVNEDCLLQEVGVETPKILNSWQTSILNFVIISSLKNKRTTAMV